MAPNSLGSAGLAFCLSAWGQTIKNAEVSMSSIILSLLSAVTITGGVAFTTVYGFSQEAPAIAEVFSSIFVAMICANLR
jgi:hypothetical protein